LLLALPKKSTSFSVVETGQHLNNLLKTSLDQCTRALKTLFSVLVKRLTGKNV